MAINIYEMSMENYPDVYRLWEMSEEIGLSKAEKYRLIQSLREKKSSPKGIATKVQGLINTLILP